MARRLTWRPVRPKVTLSQSVIAAPYHRRARRGVEGARRGAPQAHVSGLAGPPPRGLTIAGAARMDAGRARRAAGGPGVLDLVKKLEHWTTLVLIAMLAVVVLLSTAEL